MTRANRGAASKRLPGLALGVLAGYEILASLVRMIGILKGPKIKDRHNLIYKGRVPSGHLLACDQCQFRLEVGPELIVIMDPGSGASHTGVYEAVSYDESRLGPFRDYLDRAGPGNPG